MPQLQSPPNRPGKAQLKINPTPFKPSHLSIPPSPFSPRSPLALIHNLYPSKPSKGSSTTSSTSSNPSNTASSKSNSTSSASPVSGSSPQSHPPPPPTPQQRPWQCHPIHRTYGLGVTRRCLDDGHLFCAGTTTIKNWRAAMNPRGRNKNNNGARVKRHRACGSEYDYAGWKTWGRWRRTVSLARIKELGEEDDTASEVSFSSASSMTSGSSAESSSERSGSLTGSGSGSGTGTPAKKKDCWNTCDYPSECRWGRQFGVHTPLEVQFPTLPVITAPSESQAEPTPNSKSNSPINGEGILKPENIKESTSSTFPKNPTSAKEKERSDFWSALLASATRRKSNPPSSPLANVPEELEPESPTTDVETDSDGDIVMPSPKTFPTSNLMGEREGDANALTVNPQHLTLSSSVRDAVAASISATASVVTLKDLIKRKSSKKGRRRNEKRNTERRSEMRSEQRCSEELNRAMAANWRVRSEEREARGLGTIQEDVDGGMQVDFAPLRRVRSRDSGYHGRVSLVGGR